MAQAISNKVLVQSNKYCWMICDYSMSGTTLSYTLSFYFEGGCAQLDNAWIAVGGTDVWRNSGRIHNYESATSPAHTVSIYSGTTTITGSKTVTFGITKYSGVAMSGSFSVTGGTPPTGASATLNGTAYNLVKIYTSVTSWGTNYAGTPNLEAIVVDPSATSSNWTTKGRTVKRISTNSLNSILTVSGSGDAQYDGGYEIKGATPFKIASYGSTNIGSTLALNNTTYYTNPAPLTSVTSGYNAISAATGVGDYIDVLTKIKGGDSTVNNTNTTVTFQYRRKIDSGSWSGWTNGPTGAANASKTVSVHADYGQTVYVEGRQLYMGKYSDVKSDSVTIMDALSPSISLPTIDAKTWNSISLSGTTNYRRPLQRSGRSIKLGVAETASTSAPRREVSTLNESSASVTVNNSSTAVNGTLNLKGMMGLHTYIYADNTKKSIYEFSADTTYLPPSPGQLTYVKNGSQYTVTYTGVAGENVTTYDAADLVRSMRYKIDDGAWIDIESDVQKGLTALTSDTITITAGHTATVEAWMTYKGVQSQVNTVSITNTGGTAKFYGSTIEMTRLIDNIYGSVGGQTKAISKIYGSKDGVTTTIFEA